MRRVTSKATFPCRIVFSGVAILYATAAVAYLMIWVAPQAWPASLSPRSQQGLNPIIVLVSTALAIWFMTHARKIKRVDLDDTTLLVSNGFSSIRLTPDDIASIRPIGAKNPRYVDIILAHDTEFGRRIRCIPPHRGIAARFKDPREPLVAILQSFVAKRHTLPQRDMAATLTEG